MSNIVYIATSLDGYISAPDGGLDWLECVPNPAGDDLGFSAFMERVDAIVMGRITFETGDRLFGKLEEQLMFELVGTEVLLGHLVKRHYRRARA